MHAFSNSNSVFLSHTLFHTILGLLWITQRYTSPYNWHNYRTATVSYWLALAVTMAPNKHECRLVFRLIRFYIFALPHNTQGTGLSLQLSLWKAREIDGCLNSFFWIFVNRTKYDFDRWNVLPNITQTKHSIWHCRKIWSRAPLWADQQTPLRSEQLRISWWASDHHVNLLFQNSFVY